ncbi:MAG: neutral/alkaline non-lysosomal ceramidase N-terminal domain-containing protein [Clostridiales bacterium]|nr:neutral/alkaline non-lysosomal ceramidase N-terminal domain-containing protein [Clostridiales bacterium]
MKKRLLSIPAIAISVALIAGSVSAASSVKARTVSAGSSGKGNVQHEVVMDGEICDLLTLGGAAKAVSKIRSEKDFKYVAFSYLEYGITKLVSFIANVIPEPETIIDEKDYVSTNFYRGTGNFTKTPSQSAKWSLGYSQESLLPDDILTGNYYLAGYMQSLTGNKVETVLDDMKVRTIVLDDNSGNGASVFSTIECIGLSNHDVRVIRGMLGDYSERYNLASINISSTHTHSEIDTLGLWNPMLKTVINNVLHSITGKGRLMKGVNEEFMELLYERVAKSIRDACDSMKPGELYYAEKSIKDYIENRRSPDCYLENLSRFRFVPDDRLAKETVIVNMGAHPFTTGLKTSNSSGRELSADYTAYMEEIVNKAGANFMFIQGAISGVYSDRGQSNDGLDLERRSYQTERYGRELGRITMALTLTEEEIKNNELLANTQQVEEEMKQSESYTLWYEDWTPVEETRVEPIINIRLREVKLVVENPIIKAVGKLNLANYDMIKTENGEYAAYTEIGYLEIGKDLKVVMLPGEYTPDLAIGGALMEGENTFSGTDFPYPSLKEIVGDDILAFGMANDEVGYVLPDNDYCMIFFEGDKVFNGYFGNHYQESISFGKHVGSTITKGFMEMMAEFK